MTTTSSLDLDRALGAAASPTRPEWRTILISTDGSAESDGAVTLAGALAARTGATLHAIAVTDTPRMIRDRSAPVFDQLSESVDEEERWPVVARQLQRLLAEVDCPLVMRRGEVSDVVSHHADELAADLLVVGRGHHDLVTRMRGAGHLLDLVRAAPCPVLAATAEPQLPRRIVVGIDFSPRSAEIVRTAVQVAADGATIYLVNVKPDPPFGIPHPGRWLDSYDEGVRAGLQRVEREVVRSPSLVVETIVVQGHPGEALVAFARTAQADLIAVGRRGAGFLDRLLVGSVTTRLVHSAPCSLLVVPDLCG